MLASNMEDESTGRTLGDPEPLGIPEGGCPLRIVDGTFYVLEISEEGLNIEDGEDDDTYDLSGVNAFQKYSPELHALCPKSIGLYYEVRGQHYVAVDHSSVELSPGDGI